MAFTVNIIFSALLGLLGVYLYRKKTREKRINTYFCTAVRVYAVEDRRPRVYPWMNEPFQILSQGYTT